MIYYDERSWLDLVMRFTGTSWESTWHLVLLVFLLSLLVYILEVRLDFQIAGPGHTIFGATLSYLLVFRANNASDRFWTGRGHLTHMFLNLREMVMAMCIIMRGGAAHEMWRRERASRSERVKIEDAWDIRASMARVNFVRWVLAFAVSMKLYCRIAYPMLHGGYLKAFEKGVCDWDRIRLRGLMSRQEFEEINDFIPFVEEEHVTRGAQSLLPHFIDEVMEGAYVEEGRTYELDQQPDMRQPVAILFKIWIEVARHMDEPWGFKGRFAKDHLALCHSTSMLFENIVTLIITPIPFPYVHLCKILLVCFLVMTPLVVNPNYGLFVNVVLPTGVAMSLLGIDAISSELENPFGDDLNDLDLMRAISVLEADCMKLLELSGDFRAQGSFVPYGIPKDVQGEGPEAVRSFLVLSTQLQKEKGMFQSVQFEQMAQQMNRIPNKSALAKERKTNLAKRMSSFAPEHNRTAEDDDMIAQTRPLLSDQGGLSGGVSGTMADFTPMPEFGAETIVLEDNRHGGRAQTDHIMDIVGLDTDDEFSEGGDATDMHQNASAHMSGIFPSGKTSGRPGQSPSPGPESDAGFKPIEEFGYEEIRLPDRRKEPDINDDPIYGDSSPTSPAPRTPDEAKGKDKSQDKDTGGFVKMSFDSSEADVNLEDEVADDVEIDLNMGDGGDSEDEEEPAPKPKSKPGPSPARKEDSGSEGDDESEGGFQQMKCSGGTADIVLPEEEVGADVDY